MKKAQKSTRKTDVGPAHPPRISLTIYPFDTGVREKLGYMATNHFFAEGIFGFQHFPAGTRSACDLYQFSANGKAYLTGSGANRPVVYAGIGGDKFSPGSTYFGGMSVLGC